MSASDPAVRLVAALVRNTRGEVLVALDEGTWRLPTGEIEPDESTRAAGVREVMEETGVRAALGHVIAVEEKTTTDRHEQRITFTGVALTDEITLDDPDQMVTDARWVSLEDAAELLPDHPVGIRRLAAIDGVPYVDLLDRSE